MEDNMPCCNVLLVPAFGLVHWHDGLHSNNAGVPDLELSSSVGLSPYI